MAERKRLLVTGSTGFLGQAVMRRLVPFDPEGWYVFTFNHRASDLLNPDDVHTVFQYVKPDAVLHLAYPGSRWGIETSVKTPYTLASHLVQMDLNVVNAAVAAKVETLLCVGSACAYPEHTEVPTIEEDLWQGYPEPVNAAYGLAKRNQLMLLQAARAEHGLNGLHVILSNLYGPGDRSGHVIPSLIRKIRLAQRDGGAVEVWGHPEVTRSFLYVDDAAEGLLKLLDRYRSPEPINLCGVHEVSMATLALMLSETLGSQQPVHYDADRPTGHLRRLFSHARLQAALDGWLPGTTYRDGFAQTVAWTLAHIPLEAAHV